MNIQKDIRNKYLSRWVMAETDIKLGDIVAFTCDWEGVEVRGEVIDIIGNSKIAIETADRDITVVDFHRTIVYNVTSLQPKKNLTDCGCTGYDLFHFGCKCGFVKK